ncbi:helix-turn-helix domain-containing protein [Sphingomonas hankookensis]|uniref:helix-turn-helix domain-containing protein n=1 Tax=Sphingomonas hankookensis TaxID=563996 RepID=UPI003D302C32
MQADELRDLRKGLGMGQQELADAIGMSRKLVSEMERSAAPIERRTALAVRYVALMGELNRPLD